MMNLVSYECASNRHVRCKGRRGRDENGRPIACDCSCHERDKDRSPREADVSCQIETKLKRIIEAVGISAAAEILHVGKAQLSRCQRGKESIDAELTRLVSSLEFIIDRALQVMNVEDVGPWFASPEPLLGGSTPMNVLTLAGPTRVVDAINAIVAGSFA